MSSSYRRKTAEEVRAEMDELSKKLAEGVTEYLKGDRFKEILDNVSKLHNYSINNCLLIALQKPDASYVASYTDWQKKFNRQVEAGQTGIKIFMPTKYKVKEEVETVDENGNKRKEERIVEKTGFKVGTTFDISQTKQIEGKPVIELEPVKELQGDIADFETLKEVIVKTAPVSVRSDVISGGAKGYFSDQTGEIVINEGMSETQTLKTLLHEIAHSYLHSSDKPERLSYYVAECGEYPNLGEYHEGLNVEEAVKAYKHIPSERMNALKTIGIKLEKENGEEIKWGMVFGDKVQIDDINLVDDLRESFEVQKAIMQLRRYFDTDGFELKSLREVQAESCAYIVATHLLGTEVTKDYSLFNYYTSEDDVSAVVCRIGYGELDLQSDNKNYE